MARTIATITWALVLGATMLTGCGDDAAKGEKDEKSEKGEKGAQAKGAGSAAAASKKEKSTCADFGGTGELSFDKPCNLKAPSPVKGKWTGGYVKRSRNSDELPEIEIENGFELEIMWGNVTVYYYDKDGKQLEVTFENGEKSKAPYTNGSGIFQNLKPGEKKKLAFGAPKAQTPAGTESIEVEISAFGYELPDKNPKNKYFWVERPTMWDQRPKGGWK
jgi:hypothetical protein